MRHGKKFNHLSRTAPHRAAMLANMASSLITHKHIVTTVAKAKALRKYVEPMITKSKTDSTHNRRIVFSDLQDKLAVKELFSTVAEKVAERPGGYTRILKLGNRAGDNADMAMIELVDFNEFFEGFDKDKKAGKTRRSRRGSSAPSATVTKNAPEAKTKAVEEVPAVEVAEEVVSNEVATEDHTEAIADAVIEMEDETPVSEDSTPTDNEEAKEEENKDNA